MSHSWSMFPGSFQAKKTDLHRYFILWLCFCVDTFRTAEATPGCLQRPLLPKGLRRKMEVPPVDKESWRWSNLGRLFSDHFGQQPRTTDPTWSNYNASYSWTDSLLFLSPHSVGKIQYIFPSSLPGLTAVLGPGSVGSLFSYSPMSIKQCIWCSSGFK